MFVYESSVYTPLTRADCWVKLFTFKSFPALPRRTRLPVLPWASTLTLVPNHQWPVMLLPFLKFCPFKNLVHTSGFVEGSPVVTCLCCPWYLLNSPGLRDRNKNLDVDFCQDGSHVSSSIGLFLCYLSVRKAWTNVLTRLLRAPRKQKWQLPRPWKQRSPDSKGKENSVCLLMGGQCVGE